MAVNSILFFVVEPFISECLSVCAKTWLSFDILNRYCAA